MQNVSALWDVAVRNGFPVVSTIDVYRGTTPIAFDVPWAQPSKITVDETAQVWRSCLITVGDIDRDILPKTPFDALAPFGPDLHVRCGFAYPNGTVEQVPVGVFRIMRSDPTPAGLVTLVGLDRSAVVAAARFERPQVFARGVRNAVAIRTLIAERVPGVEFEFEDLGVTLPLTVFEEGERFGSPWKACVEMAEGGAQQVLFAPNGSAKLRTPPNLDTSSVAWNFADGVDGTKISVAPRWDATTAYNVFVCTGESSELASGGVAAARGSAEITDPASPIHPGVFGRRPTFLASTFVKTDQQAQQVAAANLPLRAGVSDELVITGWPNPAFEGGDVVYAEEATLDIARNAVVSRFSFDLGLTDEVTYACRSRRIT